MSGRSYRFGEFRLDPARRELWRGVARLPLQAKSFDCLAYLIECRERAVGRDELISAVWGKVEIQGSLLRQTILQARRAIDEAGQDAIQTVPNFGYRWGLETRIDYNDVPAPLAAAPPHVASTISQVAATPALRSRFDIGWLAAPTLVVLVALAWSHFESGPENTQADDPIGRQSCAEGGQLVDVAAVMPARISPDEGTLSWARLGLMELIGDRLRKGGQQVVPSEDVIALRVLEQPEEQAASVIRNATCVRYLVIPRVQRSDSDWAVHLELRDAEASTREAEAVESELVAAARNASDYLLVQLGYPIPVERGGADAIEGDELLARIHIALVTQDLDTATRLMVDAPDALQATWDFRWSQVELLFARGDFDVAFERLKAMAVEPEANGGSAETARVQTALALIEVNRAQPERAMPLLDQVIASRDIAKHNGLIGNAHNTRGLAHAMLGHYDQAGSDFAAARHAFMAAGRVARLALVDSNDGMVWLSRNRPADAVPLLTSAVARSERFNKAGVGMPASYLAWAHLLLLEPAEAARVFERYDSAVAQDGGYTSCQYDYYKARTLVANGRLSEARELLEALRDSTNDYCRGDGLAQIPWAQVELADDRLVAALENARQAVEILDNPSEARERAEAWLLVTRALHGMEDEGAASVEVEHFHEWAERLDDPAARVHGLLARAEHHWRQGRLQEARAGYDEALQVARSDGVPADVSLVASSYGHTLLDAGDIPEADRVAAQIARWADQDFHSAVLLAAVRAAQGQREQWQAHLNRARLLAGERPIPTDAADASSL